MRCSGDGGAVKDDPATEAIRHFQKAIDGPVDEGRPFDQNKGGPLEEETGFYYSFRTSLFQILSNRRVLRYQWINSFETKPHHQLQEVKLMIRYRQRVWRDWMYVEMTPQVSFPRERDFKNTPGFMVRVEIIMGKVRERMRRQLNKIM